MDEETVELGGKIQLTGFSSIEHGQLIVVKKIVGHYAKKFSDMNEGFNGLKVTMKKIHGEDSDKFELNALLDIPGGPYNAKVEDRNLFFGIDKVMKKIEEQMS